MLPYLIPPGTSSINFIKVTPNTFLPHHCHSDLCQCLNFLPLHSQHNGYVGCQHRHTVEIGLTILSNANVPHIFFGLLLLPLWFTLLIVSILLY